MNFFMRNTIFDQKKIFVRTSSLALMNDQKLSAYFEDPKQAKQSQREDFSDARGLNQTTITNITKKQGNKFSKFNPELQLNFREANLRQYRIKSQANLVANTYHQKNTFEIFIKNESEQEIVNQQKFQYKNFQISPRKIQSLNVSPSQKQKLLLTKIASYQNQSPGVGAYNLTLSKIKGKIPTPIFMPSSKPTYKVQKIVSQQKIPQMKDLIQYSRPQRGNFKILDCSYKSRLEEEKSFIQHKEQYTVQPVQIDINEVKNFDNNIMQLKKQVLKLKNDLNSWTQYDPTIEY